MAYIRDPNRRFGNTMATESIIDFSSIAPGKSVRAVKSDGVYYMPRRDIIMSICNKNAKDASTVWTRDITDEEKQELSTFCMKHRFEGNGFGETECYNLEGTILLSMMLPGKFARKIRRQAARLMTDWVRDNTDDPLLREMATSAQISKKRERDDELIDIDIAERRAKIAAMNTDVKERLLRANDDEATAPLRFQQSAMTAYQALCPNNILDDRARILFKDIILNLTLPKKTIENGEDPEGNPRSVSDHAMRMQLSFTTAELQKIGGYVADRFRERYGHDVDFLYHEQTVNGRKVGVKNYVQKDHDILVAGFADFDKAKNQPVKRASRAR